MMDNSVVRTENRSWTLPTTVPFSTFPSMPAKDFATRPIGDFSGQRPRHGVDDFGHFHSHLGRPQESRSPKTVNPLTINKRMRVPKVPDNRRLSFDAGNTRRTVAPRGVLRQHAVSRAGPLLERATLALCCSATIRTSHTRRPAGLGGRGRGWGGSPEGRLDYVVPPEPDSLTCTSCDGITVPVQIVRGGRDESWAPMGRPPHMAGMSPSDLGMHLRHAMPWPVTCRLHGCESGTRAIILPCVCMRSASLHRSPKGSHSCWTIASA